MNVDFDPSAVTNFLRGIVRDLREKRLWPIAVALLVAIVATPILLSNSSSNVPVAQTPLPALPPSASTSLPALSVQTTPVHSRLPSSAHDPFAQQRIGTRARTGSTAASATSTATTVGRAVSTTPARSTSSGTGSVTVAAPRTTGPATTTRGPITANAGPTPRTTGLSPTESYHVTLAITNPGGGLDTIDPLERLSVLPSLRQPLLVELGVLQGGHRVLFAVQPGTVVSGPGTCIPGPIDCEILSLAHDRTEALGMQSPKGVVSVALFAITGITADQHLSAVAANKARRSESAAGRALLSKSTLRALALFRYEPSIGALVDLRNLTVRGAS